MPVCDKLHAVQSYLFIYFCQVRAALMKSLGVYMSLRGNLDWIPRRHSMFSGAYGTAADTEQQCNENQNR